MSPLVDWRKLAGRVESVINQQWGERIRIVPMQVSEYSDATENDARPSCEVVAVFTTAQDMVVNLAGDHAGSPFRERIAVSNLAVSVRTRDVIGTDPQTGDIVLLLERNDERYEISRASPDATGRTAIALIRS